jgi:L-threonylcarbamoyladenylate synthase
MPHLSRFQLRLAAQWLRAGEILAYPTEAVWGLGCDPFNPSAVDALLALKSRPRSKGLILIAAEFGQIEPMLRLTTTKMREQMLASWPGPVTWIAPAAAGVPVWLCGTHDTLAVRVSDHPLAAALCRAFGGPIVSTSANPTGAPPARSKLQARAYFRYARLRFLAGETGQLRQPSAIYDASTGLRVR